MEQFFYRTHQNLASELERRGFERTRGNAEARIWYGREPLVPLKQGGQAQLAVAFPTAATGAQTILVCWWNFGMIVQPKPQYVWGEEQLWAALAAHLLAGPDGDE